MIRMPEIVQHLLESSIARVRRIYLLRGLAATLAALLAAALCVMAIDAKFTLFSDVARWGLSALLYASVGVVAYFVLARPLMRKIDLLRVAKILDGRHPENEECLTTLVEIVAEAENKGRLGCSEALFVVLSRKAESAAKSIVTEREFTSRTIVRRLKWLLGVAAVLVLSFIAVPHVAGRLFLRAVAPWVDVGNLYSNDIEVLPGDAVVLAGGTVRIEVKINADLHSLPLIRISRRSTIGWGEEFVSEMPGGVYEATADLSEPVWRYRVCAGPAVTRYYTIRVCELPKAQEFLAKVEYPAYTGWTPSVHSNDEVSVVSALEGSRVTFSLKTPKNVHGTFLIDNHPVFEHQMVSTLTANWTLDLANDEGFQAPQRWGLLKSCPDTAPTVLIETPVSKSLKLPPHAKFPLQVSASDDVTLAMPVIRYSTDASEWREWREIASCTKSGASLWKGSDEIDLSVLPLLDVRQVSFDVVVSDNYPAELGGPHSATSAPVVVQLEYQAKNFEQQSLAETSKESKKLLDEALRRVRDASNPTRQAREMLKREKKVTEQVEARVERANHEANEARKRLEEVEQRMSADERFRPTAEAVRKIREERLQPVLDDLEKAQFASAEERLQALWQAETDLRKVEDALQQLERPMQERVQQLENLERTKDLQVRQEALAKAAEDILKERPVDTKKLEAWKRMEEEAVRQVEDLRNRTNDPELEEARRKMSRATEMMDQLKRELENAADKTKNDDQRQQREEELAREEQARREDALRSADDFARKIEKQLKDMQKNAQVIDHHQRQIESQQRALEDQLERADASARLKELAKQASDEIRKAARDPSKEDAIAAESKLRRALDAARKEMEEAKLDRQFTKDEEKRAANERRAMETEKAKAHAAEAQRQAAEAMEKKTPEGYKEAVAAAERAADELSKALIPQELRDAQEKALEAARELQKQHAVADKTAKLEEKIAELDRKAESAAADAQAADQKAIEKQHAAIHHQEAAQKAQETANKAQEAADDAKSVAAISGTAEDRQKADAAQQKANEAQHAATELQKTADQAQKIADRAHEKSAEAQQKAMDARKESADAKCVAAMASGDAAQKDEARAAAEKEAAAAAAAEAVRKDRQAAQKAVEDAQAKAAQAQKEAAKAQAKGDFETAGVAQQEAHEAQEQALEAQRRAANLMTDASPSEPSAAHEGAAHPAEQAAQESRHALAQQAAQAQRTMAEAMADADREAEAVAQADALAAKTEKMAESREDTYAAAEEFAADAALERAAKLDAVAEEAFERQNLARAAEAAKESLEAKREAFAAMKEMRDNADLPTDAAKEMNLALEAERQAIGFQEKVVQSVERAVKDPKNWHEGIPTMRSQHMADEKNREAQESLGKASQARQAEPGQTSKTPTQSGSPAEKAAEAAQKLAEQAEKQMKALGMDPQAQQTSQQSASEQQEPSEQKGEPNASVGEGLSAQIAALAQELKRNDDPAAIKGLLEKSGWFRIQGAAKEGLGERDLKAIPSEYRELVRTYFLKLAEEAK